MEVLPYYRLCNVTTKTTAHSICPLQKGKTYMASLLPNPTVQASNSSISRHMEVAGIKPEDSDFVATAGWAICLEEITGSLIVRPKFYMHHH